MSKTLNNLQPWGALLMRLVLGAAMIYHGYSKVIPAGGFHGGNMFSALERHSHYVASLGLPYWLGIVSALTEFVGGILLVLGLLTRFAAFLVAVNMLVAIVMVNRHHGYAGSEYSLALLAIAVMLFFYGAGACAMDRRFGLS
ncbi:DoxX family protein [Edaphobacter flagellatus]|uniref:DoxX family protein n=1 Tax=Edaphobacter flagellatus TaxID=1933044 RepID=UPI0021B414D8|nr:DoxX family protein [Edaphobacter flagellatus]